MQTITQNELRWVVQELYRVTEAYQEMTDTKTGIERELCNLRAGQLESIASRFETALAMDDRRIAIR